MNISQDLEKLLKVTKRGKLTRREIKMKTFFRRFSPLPTTSSSSSSSVSTSVIIILLIFILNVSISSHGGIVHAASVSVKGNSHKNSNRISDTTATTTTPTTTTTDNGESSEDGQYYDDDAAVTFITDEDIYDGITYSPYSTSQQHVGIHSSKKHLEDERCPPSALATTKLCEATRCQRDSDCSVDSSLICCYNGCIHSCLPRVDPPLAFDWLEETELKIFRNGSEEMLNLPIPPGGRALSPKMLMNADVTPETIALVGGCTITPIQYEDLRLFRKHEHIRTCTCLRGDVVCEVNVDKSRLPSTTSPAQ